MEALFNDERLDFSLNNDKFIKAIYKSGNKQIIMLLLKDGRIDPSSNNNYCIKKSAEKGHYDALKILSDDNRVNKRLGLEIAIKNNNTFSILLLMWKIVGELLWYTHIVLEQTELSKDVIGVIQRSIIKLEMHGR